MGHPKQYEGGCKQVLEVFTGKMIDVGLQSMWVWMKSKKSRQRAGCSPLVRLSCELEMRELARPSKFDKFAWNSPWNSQFGFKSGKLCAGAYWPTEVQKRGGNL